MSNLFLTPDEVTQDMLNDFKAITGIEFKLTDLKREEVIKMKTYAGAISMMRSGLRQTYDNIFPASSDEAGLIQHLASKGLPTQILSSASTGVVRITNAADGAVIPIGAQIKFNLDGRVFIAINSVTITGGIADVTFQSALVGQNQNIDKLDQDFTLVNPIVGVDNACENQTLFLDGRDKETPAEMLARIQIHDQDEDTGGNLTAYERWAHEASGLVVTAKAIKNPRGPGTVNTVITAGTTDIEAAVNGGIAVTRLPSSGLVALVQAYIVTKDPTTDDHQTIMPTEAPFNVTFTYSLYDETLRGLTDSAVDKIIKIYIYKAVPNQILYPTELERLIDAQIGHLISERRISDFSGGGPTYTVPSSTLLTPGTITKASY